MKTILKGILRKAGLEINRRDPRDPRYEVVSLRPAVAVQGNILLSYRTKPFSLNEDSQEMNAHYCNWQCLQMARTFLHLGYCVDVISWLNDRFEPKKDYTVFIDVQSNLERIGPQLNRDCVKIFHIIWAHWMFHNTAEYQRCLSLQQRRGVSLKPKRQLEPARTIELADCAAVSGNEFTMDTYKYTAVEKPMYRMPVSAQAQYPWPEEKEFETCQKNFLWFGGYGFVHKGLDLVLEAFSEMPDHHLYVCGPVTMEKDFEQAFHKELYQTPNIHTFTGWIDVCSPSFLEITNKCVGLIYTSCSESSAGSVINCMHAGLVPLVSYESGVDVNDFGFILKDCSLDTIRNTVQMVSSLGGKELKRLARQTWEFARGYHTKESFDTEYLRIAKTVIGYHASKG